VALGRLLSGAGGGSTTSLPTLGRFSSLLMRRSFAGVKDLVNAPKLRSCCSTDGSRRPNQQRVHLPNLGGLIVGDGQREFFNRIDAAVTDDGYEGQPLIEEILGGPQGVCAAVFDTLTIPAASRGLPCTMNTTRTPPFDRLAQYAVCCLCYCSCLATLESISPWRPASWQECRVLVMSLVNRLSSAPVDACLIHSDDLMRRMSVR
jgi:hypothetical protein